MAQYTFDGQTVITKSVAANNGTATTDTQDHGGAVSNEQIVVHVESAGTPVSGDYVDVYPLWSQGDVKNDPDVNAAILTSIQHTVPLKFNLFVDGAAATPCTRIIPIPNGLKFSGLHFINRSGATAANVWAENGI